MCEIFIIIPQLLLKLPRKKNTKQALFVQVILRNSNKTKLKQNNFNNCFTFLLLLMNM